MKTKYHLAVILDSTEACRIYQTATGEQAPLPPAGRNTMEVPFRVSDQTGNERAALLVVQTDWAQSPDEIARGEEADGASVVIATDASPEDGAAVLREWADMVLHPMKRIGSIRTPKKSAASRKNGMLGGRVSSTPAGMVRTRLRAALEGVYGKPLPKDDAFEKLMHCNSTPKRRAGAWAAIRDSVPEDKRAGIESILAELDAIPRK